MSDFTKNKIQFALALLGTLFALTPFLTYLEANNIPTDFKYLGVTFTLYYAYGLAAGLLAFSVYCYATALVTAQPVTTMERVGNLSYAAAILVLPLYGGLYLSHWLAEMAGISHLHWVAPTAAGVLVALWLLLAYLLRRGISAQDRVAKIKQLREQEVAALHRSKEMFNANHVDLAVIEAWRGIEARLRRVLLRRKVTSHWDDPHKMIEVAHRHGIVNEEAMQHLDTLRRQWNVAISTEPLTQEAAEKALEAAKKIVSMVADNEAATPEAVAKKQL
jgi:hypothetical protein